MNKIQNDDSCILSFSSVNEYLDTAEKSKQLAEINPNYEDNESWQFGSDIEANTQEKTYSLLRAGKGLSSVRKLSRKYREELQNSDLGEIVNRTKSVKRVRRYNDFDGNLDFDRVMSGNTDYWEKMRRDGQAQVVRIGINYSLSAGNNLDSFSRIVGLSAIFAELLENLGYGVEIYGSSLYQNHKKPSKKRKKWLGMIFPVKSVSEPLDFERIYSLGLSGLLRDAEFRIEEYVYGTHGGSCMVPPQSLIELADIDVLISKSWTNGNQVESIIQAINKL